REAVFSRGWPDTDSWRRRHVHSTRRRARLRHARSTRGATRLGTSGISVSGPVRRTLGLALGVIGAADERSRLHVAKAELATDRRQLGELVRMIVLLHGQMARRGSQVLAERQDRDIDLT